MASQNPKIIADGVHRMVSLFNQTGEALTANTDVADFTNEAPDGSAFPAGDYDGSFTAPFDGLARIAFSLSARAQIQLSEKVPGGTARTHVLNDGGQLKGDLLHWPIRAGMVYGFQVASTPTLYSLTIDAVKE